MTLGLSIEETFAVESTSPSSLLPVRAYSNLVFISPGSSAFCSSVTWWLQIFM